MEPTLGAGNGPKIAQVVQVQIGIEASFVVVVAVASHSEKSRRSIQYLGRFFGSEICHFALSLVAILNFLLIPI